ncbi:hypothetical protein TeGR_g8490 [Tetraparma gracilis]|uniref:Uncharacterized protein n=1 Tax=Tetraparma gracilis TaxID=2962635 RepID=A0ABQ6M985_9STRA|nr:hypothetical protein TeGR_g8490 [Tetraparma gracilis]
MFYLLPLLLIVSLIIPTVPYSVTPPSITSSPRVASPLSRPSTALPGSRRRSSRAPSPQPPGGPGLKVSGVTLPTAAKPLAGWLLPAAPFATPPTPTRKIAVALPPGSSSFFGLSASCPRCGFDLYKGELLSSTLGCPTCKTRFSLADGEPQGEGPGDFVSRLARTATMDRASKRAEVYAVTVDESGDVFVKERSAPLS